MKKTKLILTMLILSSILTACGNSSRTGIDSSEVIYVEDLMDESRKQEGLASELVRMTKKEDFERQYDNNIYPEDYLDVKERLDSEFAKFLQNQIEEDLSRKIVVKADMEYYNPTLKQAKEENWTLEDILKEPAKNIRKFKYDAYYFCKDLYKQKEISPYMSKKEKEYTHIGYQDIYVQFIAVENKEGEFEYDIDKINKEEKVNIKTILKEDVINDYSRHFLMAEKQLKKKYNQNFEFKTRLTKTGRGEGTFSLKSNPKIIFEVLDSGEIGTGFDKFLTAVAQKYMHELIYEILKEEGVDGYIVPLSIPYSQSYVDTDENSYDISSIKTREDVLKFLNEGYLGKYYTTLVYMKTPEEEIDYESLKKVSEKIKKIIKRRSEGLSVARQVLYIEFYEIEKDKMPRVKYLFEKESVCSAIYRENVTLTRCAS